MIEIFTDLGSTEDEINEKYPLQDEWVKKIHFWLYQNKLLLIVIGLLIIIYLFDYEEITPIKQSGGGITSPVSSTFGFVTNVLGKFLRMIMLIITVILTPTIPILLYCLIVYYVIKKFLFMITSIK